MALHYAVRNKMLAEIRSLVESGANVNARDKHRRTPLMLCCVEEDEEFAAGIARMLLQDGAKVGLVDKSGRNSLMLACSFGRFELAKLFLKAVDFNLNMKDGFENTALHFAALNGNLDVLKKTLDVFLRAGAHINSRNRMGQTAAGIALQQGHVSCVDVFKNITCAIFKTKIPRVLLMRPWSADLKYFQNPNLMLKEVVNEFIVETDMHKSRSDLNVHQFRRGSRIPEERISKRRRKSSSKQSKRSASSLTYMNSNQHRSFLSGERCASKFFLDSRITPEDPSWKVIVSDMMEVLREQVAGSYCKSAVVLPQTIEDVFKPPEPPQLDPIEGDDANEKPTSGQESRRRSATGLSRSKKSDVYDASAVCEKKKNRRCSLQSNNDGGPQLQRRRNTLAKIV